jgi:hypothetical protein
MAFCGVMIVRWSIPLPVSGTGRHGLRLRCAAYETTHPSQQRPMALFQSWHFRYSHHGLRFNAADRVLRLAQQGVQMTELPAIIRRNSTAVLCYRALPATIPRLMEVTGVSRNTVRHALLLLKSENLAHISHYQHLKTRQAACYAAGAGQDAPRNDAVKLKQATARRHYIACKFKRTGRFDAPVTQWRGA